jgi:hypothetical protein
LKKQISKYNQENSETNLNEVGISLPTYWNIL